MTTGPSALSELRSALLHLVAASRVQERIRFDPLEFPRRFTDPNDIEVVALIAASLAYGRASLFKPRIQQILEVLGQRPAAFAQAFCRAPDAKAFRSITYRFNKGPDFAAMIAAVGWMRDAHGSLGRRFGKLYGQLGMRRALTQFGEELRGAPPVKPLLRRRGERGLRYLLPDANSTSAAKRWHLYLRWMVRGPDDVDLGVWREFVPASALLIPLDTHIARVSRYLGFTARSDLSWRTAEEITEALRRIDPADPVRFDFALCHHGMSGECPTKQDIKKCEVCPLIGLCSRSAD